jgi:hypothetical protein
LKTLKTSENTNTVKSDKKENETKLIGGKSRVTKKNEKIKEERTLREEEIKKNLKEHYIFCLLQSH